MSQPQIEYYRLRDFGQKFNATIEFIRYNFQPLALIVLLIALPASVLGAFIFSNIVQNFMEFSSSNPQPDDAFAFALFGALGTNYLLLFIVLGVANAWIVSSVYSYMQLLPESEGKPDAGTVVRKSLGKVPGLVLLIIITAVLVNAGTMLFIIPGIYLGVVFLISVPVFVFEKGNIGDAISRPFTLIKGKWWSTLGLIVVSSIVAGLVSFIFVLPTYFLFIFRMLSLQEDGALTPEEMGGTLLSWSSIALFAVFALGLYLVRLIPIIAMSFQYFNLKERTEGTGLKSEIEGFEHIN